MGTEAKVEQKLHQHADVHTGGIAARRSLEHRPTTRGRKVFRSVVSTSRDNFAEKTKSRLAARAGYRCSMTGCGVATVGPSDESSEAVVNVGVAAHICAAAPNGRRYDPKMTAAERSGIHNGIWMCSTHSVEIDRDESRYTSDVLRNMKAERERHAASELNAGKGAFHGTDLIAIGPNVVGVGELVGTSGCEWSIRMDHFVEGDLRGFINFSEKFDSLDVYDRYLLVNAIGDGRRLRRGPTWSKAGASVELVCMVEEGFSRVDASRLGSTWATNSANDLYVVNGDFAMVSGLDSLPQRIKENLSMLQGESPFHPKAGSRLKEYFDAFEDSPWLQRWVKLEVIRLACIPYRDTTLNREYTPLQSVLHVNDVQQVDATRTGDWLKFRFSLDVQGVGPWEQEIEIFVPQGEIQPRPAGWEQLSL